MQQYKIEGILSISSGKNNNKRRNDINVDLVFTFNNDDDDNNDDDNDDDSHIDSHIIDERVAKKLKFCADDDDVVENDVDNVRADDDDVVENIVDGNDEIVEKKLPLSIDGISDDDDDDDDDDDFIVKAHKKYDLYKCQECGIFMGYSNPRQLCCKYYCGNNY